MTDLIKSGMKKARKTSVRQVVECVSGSIKAGVSVSAGLITQTQWRASICIPKSNFGVGRNDLGIDFNIKIKKIYNIGRELLNFVILKVKLIYYAERRRRK